MRKWIFGAGRRGRFVLNREDDVYAFIDNDPNKWGKVINHKRVYSFEEYLMNQEEDDYIIIAGQESVVGKMEQQLINAGGGSRYVVYKKEKVISFCPDWFERGDVILYHVLHDIKGLFYIDVGANDPMESSVTKFLYAFKDAQGVNIDPQPQMYERLKSDRIRDINLQVACGEKRDKMELWLQSGRSTLVKENIKLSQTECITVDVVPLTEICEQYVKNREIHFLKVDVEGFEIDVLKGMNLKMYRPWIISVESAPELLKKFTKSTDIDELLKPYDYQFVYKNGIDRYYLANEHLDLKRRFLPVSELENIYDITYIE